MDEQSRDTVLFGCRVIEMADIRGMFAGKLLAGMGAEVIRIEPIECPETARTPEYCYLNDGKRIVIADITRPDGQAELRRLAADADVLIETFTPGYLDSLGLGWDDLHRGNPGLIVGSLTDTGQRGPHRETVPDDLAAAARGGWLSVTGEPDHPLKPYGNQVFYTASLFAVNGILLALRHRHQSGQGQHIDISIHECAVATLDHVLVRQACTGETATRRGSRHWNDAFQVFPCRDGSILLSLFRQWDTLTEWMDAEGMAADLREEHWRDEAYRHENAEHIAAVIERWTRTHTTGELVETGQLMRFPWARVATIPELLEDPHFRERHFFTTINYQGKDYRVPGEPVHTAGSSRRSGHDA